ncbi:MAG TPA: 6-phosphofructokinase [Clostridia bacterium]|nr:6-phosphofructokinase [Clostridia bacterium]
MEREENENRTYLNIGVLTSGGDAPGMNAAIRAVTRAALFHGHRVFGIRRGFHGLLNGDICEMDSRTVSKMIHKGGTFLMTTRSQTFQTDEGMQKAVSMCKAFELDVIVVIGGDGSFNGGLALSKEGVPVVCLPATIDNDIGCTEYAIGYDTALNTAIEAIDKLRDTASSHERCSVVEVMGRHAGYIALNTGVTAGAEVILIPEVDFDFEKDVVRTLIADRDAGKNHYIVVVAEGAMSALDLARRIEDAIGIESRATTLGYLQRGGSPSWRDRFMASVFGLKAAECIEEGRLNRAICYRDGQVVDLDLAEALGMTKTIDEEYVRYLNRLTM